MTLTREQIEEARYNLHYHGPLSPELADYLCDLALSALPEQNTDQRETDAQVNAGERNLKVSPQATGTTQQAGCEQSVSHPNTAAQVQEEVADATGGRDNRPNATGSTNNYGGGGLASAVPVEGTLHDLRQYAAGIADNDARELVQHSADLLEVKQRELSEAHGTLSETIRQANVEMDRHKAESEAMTRRVDTLREIADGFSIRLNASQRRVEELEATNKNLCDILEEIHTLLKTHGEDYLTDNETQADLLRRFFVGYLNERDASLELIAASENRFSDLMALKGQVHVQLEAAESKLAAAKDALREIQEVWAGAEVGQPIYASEAYAIRLCKQMYQIAIECLKGKP